MIIKTLYTFYDNSGEYKSKEDVIEAISNKGYNFKYTHGLGYRDPLTKNVPKEEEEALKIIRENGWVDVELCENNTIHVNTYGANDMW